MLLPLTAQAQFTAPIRYNEGPGVKLTDSLVFHPGIALEGRYDTNALYEETNPDGAGYMRVIGHLHLATLSPQRLTGGDGKTYSQKADFRLKTAVSFREYFSDKEAVKAQRALEVDAGLGLTLFPRNVVSFGIFDDFTRTVAPPNSEVNKALERDYNRGGVKLTVAPGGGLLSFSVGYAIALSLFEDSELAYANRYAHQISLNAKWKLLPKTAVFLDAVQEISTYYDRNGGTKPANYVNNDSYPLRVFLGMGGLLTPRLSVILKLGYGNGFYSELTNYSMVLGKAELGYQFTPTAKLKGGYEHNFQDSFIGNYFIYDKVYLGYDHMIAGRFLLHGSVDYQMRRYEGFPAAPINGVTVTELNYHLVTFGLGFDWQIQEWVYVGLGYDAQVKSTFGDTPKVLGAFFVNDYVKHQVMAKVGVSY